MLTWYGRLKRIKNIISKEHPAACCEASEFKSHFVVVDKREGRDEAAFSVPFWMCVCSGAQSCLTLGDPVDCSPPGFSVHGILQARTLGWVTMPSSRASSDLGIKLLSPVHWQADSLPPEPPRKSLYWAILPLSSWALSNQEQWGVGSNFWKDWLGDPKTDWKCSRCSPYMNNECHSRYLLWIVGKHFFFLIKKKH